MALQPVLALPWDAAVERPPPGGPHALGVVGVHAKVPGVAQLLGHRPPGEVQPPAVDEVDHPLRIRGPDEHRGCVRHLAEARLALAHLELGAAAVGGGGQGVRHPLQEVNVLLGEVRHPAARGREHRRRAAVDADRDAHRAAHPEVEHPLRGLKAPLGLQVLHHHRLRRCQREAGLALVGAGQEGLRGEIVGKANRGERSELRACPPRSPRSSRRAPRAGMPRASPPHRRAAPRGVPERARRPNSATAACWRSLVRSSSSERRSSTCVPVSQVRLANHPAGETSNAARPWCEAGTRGTR